MVYISADSDRHLGPRKSSKPRDKGQKIRKVRLETGWKDVGSGTCTAVAACTASLLCRFGFGFGYRVRVTPFRVSKPNESS